MGFPTTDKLDTIYFKNSINLNTVNWKTVKAQQKIEKFEKFV